MLFLREWYMHPNGQIPAYEWAFGDVNPPVHAWAAWRVYKMKRKAESATGNSSTGFFTSCCSTSHGGSIERTPKAKHFRAVFWASTISACLTVRSHCPQVEPCTKRTAPLDGVLLRHDARHGAGEPEATSTQTILPTKTSRRNSLCTS